VGDDPFFPQPRAKGSYREPATVDLLVHDRREEATAEEKSSDEKKPVINRPLHPDEMPPSVKKEPAIGNVAREEQRFWRSHSLIAKYPRAFALVLTLIGAFSTWASVDTLMNGGYYTRAALFGPPLLGAGVFPLIFGFPSHPTEGNPRSWKIGYGVSFGVGCFCGVLLMYYLAVATRGFGH